MLTKSEQKAIDRAISDKRSPQYQQGYEAAVREIAILAKGGMTTEQIVKVLAAGRSAELAENARA